MSVPVRPLPALQWMAATFSGCSARNWATLWQKARIIGSGGGLWSRNGHSSTLPSNLAGSYCRPDSAQRLYRQKWPS